MDIVSGARIVGIASAVPVAKDPLDRLAEEKVFSSEELLKISKSLGVRSRRVAPPGMCTSDLCFAAADRLLNDLQWNRAEVDALLFITQTSDYFLPATSCVLQARLGLGNHCTAFDINLGCSGYTYGIYLAGKMLRGNLRKILILVGDTPSKIVNSRDRASAAVFGDAGTATALIADETAPDMYFETGTDGTGKDALLIPAGCFRERSSAETSAFLTSEDGSVRSAEQLYMDGPSVFSFALDRVPDAIHAVLPASGWTIAEVDAFVFHQANRFMLEYLAKKLKIPLAKVPIAMEEYGNTSSASIPLTMTALMSAQLASSPHRLILSGFGVGFSWAIAGVTVGPVVMSPLVEVA